MYQGARIDLDSNGRPIYAPLPFLAKRNVVFAGGVADAIGDIDGDLNPLTLFTVTGDVLVILLPVCKDTLVGAATLEVGVTNATAALLAQIANATAFVINEGYVDATPTLGEAFTLAHHLIGGGLDIIQTLGAADVTAGEIEYYCFWRPLSADGLVVAA